LADQPGGLTALREGFTHRARPLLEAVIDHRLADFINRHGDRPDSVELRVAALDRKRATQRQNRVPAASARIFAGAATQRL
jgi:hypothetical protein